MFDQKQLTQYRDSLIEEHRGIHKDESVYDISIQAAVLVGQISCLTHALGEGGYDPIKKKLRKF